MKPISAHAVADVPMPRYKHLPGKNARPTDGLLERIASHESAAIFTLAARDNLPWQYGIRLFNEAYYWEAHEVLEAVWQCAPQNSRERFLVQCLIQISNARLKLDLAKPNAASRLKELAESCRQRAFPQNDNELLGVKAETIAMLVQHCDSKREPLILDLVLLNGDV